MSGKTGTTGPDQFDELDLQIVAFKSSKPGITLREISQETGRSINCIFERLKTIRKSDWFQEACAQAQNLVPKAIGRVEQEIDENTNEQGHSSAVAVLNGLGVFKTKHEHGGNVDLGANLLRALDDFRKLPDDKRAEIIAKLESADAESGP